MLLPVVSRSITPVPPPAERQPRSQLQAAQRPRHLGGVEPRGLERVRRRRGGRRGQPVGPVGGVVRRERPGGGGEGPAASAPVPAPGSDGGQGDPLAPAGPRRDDLHRSVGIQRVQDNIGVEEVLRNKSFLSFIGTNVMSCKSQCLIL